MHWPIFDLFSTLLFRVDGQVAHWFQGHLTNAFAAILMGMSGPGSTECVGPLTAITAIVLARKRLWRSLVTLGFTVPGGMAVNEIIKDTIQRQRPLRLSPYIDVTGYSFPSAHTMAATLIYGSLLIFLISAIKSKHVRLLLVAAASLLVLMVAFSRVALGAHYVTDVVGAIAVSAVWLWISLLAVERIRPLSAAAAPTGGKAASNQFEAALPCPD